MSDGTETMLRTLRTSRNTRAFAPDPVAEEALTAILEVGRRTGSAMNVQPWEFVVVRDPATIRALSETGQNLAWLVGAPLLVVLVMAGERPEVESFDEGRLAERLLLAAAAQGLGAGLGRFFGAAGRRRARDILGVSEPRTVHTVVAIGHPAPPAPSPAPAAGTAAEAKHPTRARKPLADLVHRERYGG